MTTASDVQDDLAARLDLIAAIHLARRIVQGEVVPPPAVRATQISAEQYRRGFESFGRQLALVILSLVYVAGDRLDPILAGLAPNEEQIAGAMFDDLEGGAS